MIQALKDEAVAQTPEAPVRSTPRLFNAAEVKELHDDDKHAGAAVVSIMAAIFTAGLMLYLFIFLWVWNYPN